MVSLSQRVINEPHEYLFVTIDDFSRELYANIFPDKILRILADFLFLYPEYCLIALFQSITMLLAAIRFVNTLQLLSLHDRNLIT